MGRQGLHVLQPSTPEERILGLSVDLMMLERGVGSLGLLPAGETSSEGPVYEDDVGCAR